MQRATISLLFSLSFGLSACSTWERHPRSGYSSDSPLLPQSSYELDVHTEKKRLELQLAKQELGFTKNQTLTEEQQRLVLDRLTLKNVESGLTTGPEKVQYYKVKPHFKSDQERIQFLNIPSLSGREKFLASIGLEGNEPAMTPQEESAIQANDIIHGMRREAVQESWGEPDLREVSGNPILGNERWSYRKYVASPDGYVLETRTLYFESGRLVGWKKSSP